MGWGSADIWFATLACRSHLRNSIYPASRYYASSVIAAWSMYRTLYDKTYPGSVSAFPLAGNHIYIHIYPYLEIVSYTWAYPVHCMRSTGDMHRHQRHLFFTTQQFFYTIQYMCTHKRKTVMIYMCSSVIEPRLYRSAHDNSIILQTKSKNCIFPIIPWRTCKGQANRTPRKHKQASAFLRLQATT